MVIYPVSCGYVCPSATSHSFPNEVFENILRHIDNRQDIKSFNLVCRQFYYVSLESCKRVELTAYRNFIALFDKNDVVNKNISILEPLILKADYFINLRVFLREIEVLLLQNLHLTDESIPDPRSPFEKRILTLMKTVKDTFKLLDSERNEVFDDQLMAIFNNFFGSGYKCFALELSDFFMDPKKRDSLIYIYILSLVQRGKVDEAWNLAIQITTFTNKYLCLDPIRDAYQAKNDRAGVAKVSRIMNFLPVNFDKLLKRTKFDDYPRVLEYASLAVNTQVKDSHLFAMALEASSKKSEHSLLVPGIIRSIECPSIKNTICFLTGSKFLSQNRLGLAYKVALEEKEEFRDFPFSQVAISYARKKRFHKAIVVASKIKCDKKSSLTFVEISDLLLKEDEYSLCIKVLLKVNNADNLKFLRLQSLLYRLAKDQKLSVILDLLKQNEFPEDYKERLIEGVVKLLSDYQPLLAREFIFSLPMEDLTVSAVAKTAYAFYHRGNFSEAHIIIRVSLPIYISCFHQMLEIALVRENLPKILEFVMSSGNANDKDDALEFVSCFLYNTMNRAGDARKTALMISDKNKKERLLSKLRLGLTCL